MFGLNIAFFLTRLVDLYVDGFLAPKVEKTESKLDDTLLLVVKKSVKWFIWLISVVVVLENLDVNIASLVAGLGIGGLAVALAAQETLKNFFGSYSGSGGFTPIRLLNFIISCFSLFIFARA